VRGAVDFLIERGREREREREGERERERVAWALGRKTWCKPSTHTPSNDDSRNLPRTKMV